MSVVDQYSDPAYGTLFALVSRSPALETFVKSAELSAPDGLPESAFAWGEHRKFPIHTPEHAALSYAYSKLASDLPAQVGQQIERALEAYGIDARQFDVSSTKVAAEESPDDYLVPEHKLFRCKSAADVSRAQTQLVQNLSKLDLESRATACANLVKKASEHDVKLHPEVQRLAGFVVSSTKTAREWLEARATVVKEATYKTAYRALAQTLDGRGAELRDRPQLLKLASVIADLDEKSGLDRHYDRKLPDALKTVFNTEKLAAETVDLGGVMVPVTKLASLPSSFWEDLGGVELSNELCPGGRVDMSKLATVVDTLPLDLKLVLRGQLRM